MDWWQRLKHNSTAQLGALVLLLLYLSVLGAEFLAPYDPYFSQPNGALLPPTQVYWHDLAGTWIGPHVYPTTQGPLSLETGDRQLIIDWDQPTPLRWFGRGDSYQLWGIGALSFDLHLLTTTGEAKVNWLGTDDQGRDQLSRLLYGGRISMSVGLVGIIIAFPLGMLMGGISGYFGGLVDSSLMRIVEVLMTIPSLYLLIALAAVLPPGLTSAQRFLLIVLIMSLVRWAGLARVIRGQVLSIKELEFVQAARAMGGKSLYIIVRHVLPQTASYVVVSATLSIPSFISSEAVLSLIGLGIQQPDPSWGNMLSVATNASIVVLQPWLIWPPATLIVVTVLCFNLLGDGLRDALDPQSLN
jgi:peptide/nickel transport system permease protein